MRVGFVRCSMIAGALAALVAPGFAQVRTVDPNEAIDSDLRTPATVRRR